MGTNPFKPSVTGGTTPAVSRETTNPFRAAEAAGDTAVERFIRALEAAVEAAGDIPVDQMEREDAVAVLGAYKGLTGTKGAGKALETSLKARLWSLVGGEPGKFRTPSGRQFTFRRGATVRRSVKYTDLQAKYPEVYAECVTETAVDPDSPASLYL